MVVLLVDRFPVVAHLPNRSECRPEIVSACFRGLKEARALLSVWNMASDDEYMKMAQESLSRANQRDDSDYSAQTLSDPKEFIRQYEINEASRRKHEEWQQRQRDSSVWWAMLSIANLVLCGTGIVMGVILALRRLDQDSTFSALFCIGIAGVVCVLCARSAVREMFKDFQNFNDPKWDTGSDHTSVLGVLIVIGLFNLAMVGAIWPSDTPSIYEDAPPEVQYDRPPY